MSTITLPADSLRALLDVYKASLEVNQILDPCLNSAIPSEGEHSDEYLHWIVLSASHIELNKVLDQAKSQVTGLEAILNTAPSSMNLKLSVQVEGQETDDLQAALAEVLRLVRNDFTSGYDSNETGRYRFTVE